MTCRLRFFFEYGADGCLWPDNEEARQRFGTGPVDEFDLGLSEKMIAKLEEIYEEYMESYNEENPKEPKWTDAQFEEFYRRTGKFLEKLNEDLGDDYEIVNALPD